MPKAADPICDGDSSSADEGDNNKSFVKKVKSHVTGFLPSKLSKWLGGKSRQREERDDEEDSYELQPPPKRAKTHNLDFDMSDISTPLHPQIRNPFSQEFREPVPGPSVTTRKLVLPASNHYNQNQPDHTNGVDSDSELPGHGNAPPNHNNSTIVGNKSIFNTSIPLERSLFGEHFTSPKKANSSLSSRRPSFNASAFGAPNFMDKTLSTRRIFNSPFYSGRITYGGASAYNRSVLPTSPDRPALSPAVKPKAVNENKNAALSKTARRILDTLEQYTSPAQDVRRIPTDHRRAPRPEGLISKYIGANPYSVRETPKLPSNSELQVPTMSDLLKMKLKGRLQESTSSVRDIANRASAFDAEEYSFRNNDDDRQAAGKSTNKIKTKVSSVRQKCAPADELVPEVKLPDVQLPISTLPSFNFSIPKPQTDAAPKKSAEKKIDFGSFGSARFGAETTEKASKTVASPTSPAPVAAPAINFKSPEVKAFAASPSNKMPARVKLPTALEETKQLVKHTKNEFQFSKPLVIAENKFKSMKAINNFKFSAPLVKKTLNGLPPIDKVVAASIPKGGVVDQPLKVEKTDKWECSACMIKNIPAATTCICCTTPKPSDKPAVNGPSKPASIASSWGDKFKAASNSWTCSVCMITNNADKEKCAACENPKPSAAASSAPAPAPTTKAASGFAGFSKKSDEWACPSCMVNNANTKDKCVCCDTPKPGAKPTSRSQASAGTGTFSLSSFVTKKSDTWECSVCMIQNKLDKEKCEACTSPRPAGVAPPKGIDGFKKDSEWECTSCMVPNPSGKDKCVCCEAPKPGSKPVPTAQVKEVPKFSFGIENGLINGQGFMFGIPPEKNVKADEKKVNFAAEVEKAKENCAPGTQFLFGIKSPNGAKPTLPSVEATSAPKTTGDAPSFSFGIPAGSKRASPKDEADAPKSPKKSEASVTFPTNPVNGSLSKTDAAKADPPKFTFGTINNAAAGAPGGASTLFGAEAKPAETKTTVPTFGGKATAAATPTFSFNATPAAPVAKNEAGATKPADKAAAPMFKFNAASTPAPTPAFNATNGPAPTFNFSAKTPATSAETTATFQFDAKPNSFGSAAPTFGAAAAASGASSVFGSANATFGSSNQTSAAPAPTPTFGSSGMSFGSNATTPVTFGANKTDPPAFGAPAAPAPAFGSSSASAFGKPTTNGVFSFGGGGNPAASETKPAFSFGSSAALPAATGTFSFGSSASTQNTNGAFSFGGNDAVPKFNASAAPTFNFTGGAPSAAAFSAQPSETKAAQSGRVIRRAIRRTQR